MQKPATTNYKIHELIAQRWSPRAFDGSEIDDKTLKTLFEAARWAPSAMNEQPWRFIYAKRGEPAFDLIVEGLMEGNQSWAKNASVLVVNIVKTTYSLNGQPNAAAKHDLGLAIGNLSLQATEEGLHLHQMGGIKRDKLISQFALSGDYDPVTVIAIGRVADPEILEGGLKERETAPRTRKSLDEIVFHGSFN